LDDSNRPITAQQLKFISISLIPSHEKVHNIFDGIVKNSSSTDFENFQIVKVQDRPNTSTDMVFDIQGFSLGHTMVTAVVTYNNKQIRF